MPADGRRSREGRPAGDPLPGTLQEILLALIAFDASAAGAAVAGLVTEDHFEGIYRDVAGAALAYRRRHRGPPGRAHIEDAVVARSPRGGADRVGRILRQLEAGAGEVNPDYALARAREHVRRVTLRTAIVEAGERYTGPEEGAVDDVEAILYRALRARADDGDAGTFLSDTARGLAFLDRNETGPFYALGIPVLDHMRVGLLPGELIVYMAAKNTGKTWFCVHCGRQAITQGARVVHVSLEMDEDRVTQRYYQTFFGIASRSDKFPMSTLDFDDLDRLVGATTRQRAPRAAFSDPGVRSWIRSRMKPWGTRLGKLVVKRFPSGQMTVDRLRGYLDYLEEVHGFIPDVLIVDYPKLMKLSVRDMRVDYGRTVVDLRGLGVERGMAVVAPSQTNRSGLDARWTTAGMVEEDKSVLDTADVVMAYSQTKMERRLGLARLGLLFSRDSERDHVIVMTQSYATGQYVVQSALQSGAYWDFVREKGGGADEEDEG